MKGKVKHVGFQGAVKSIQRKYGKAAASRIVGAAKANASAAAKRRNPRLKRTSGKKKR